MVDVVILTIVMLVNAAAFIPQTVKIWRQKSSRDVSPTTYVIFLCIQAYLIYHSVLYTQDYPLAIGYAISMLTCSAVLVTIFWFRHGTANSSCNPKEIYANDAILEKCNLLENIIAAMPGYVYWMDRGGVYLGCNDIEARAIGLSSRQEIVGKRNIDMPGFLIAKELDPVNEEIMSLGRAVTLEEPVKFLDGTIGIFISSKTPLRNSNNDVVGLLGISIDITDRKTIERDLIAAKEKAEVANKAKKQFLYNMRHDIRIPFSGISGAAAVLQKLETDPHKRQYIDAIFQSSERLLDYLNEILELTQIEDGEVPIVSQQISLKNTLQRCVDMYLPAAKEQGLDFVFDYDQRLAEEWLTDDFRVKRIVINLLGNAIKFTPKGSVRLRATLIDNSTPKHDDECMVAIQVQDTGIGIPSDKQAIIFDKFERLTASYQGKYKGSGLGLFAVKTLAEELGGTIALQSEAGQGATFTCAIPMVKPIHSLNKLSHIINHMVYADTTMTSEQHDTQVIHNKYNILLVEDDAIVQMITIALLESMQCDVSVAGTGKQAIELAENNHYDLILMDLGLPDIDGYQITQTIRAHIHRENMPIIALTAHAAQEVQEQCLNAGMNAVFSKPLSQAVADSVFNQYIK